MPASQINKYKDHPYFKYFLIIIITFAFYISYKIYVWTNTQSTDNAYLEADISLVSSEVNGVIKNILVYDNSMVNADEVIAEIDDQDFKARLAKAESDVNAASQEIEIMAQKILIEQINLKKNKELQSVAKTNLDITETDYKRTKELSRENFISKKLMDGASLAFDKVKSEYFQRELDVQINEQNLLSYDKQKLAKLDNLESAIQERNLQKRALANTKIRAPISGKLAGSSLKIGNYVRSGVVLFAVVPDDLYVKANFKETQIAKFKPEMAVKLKFDSAPKYEITGKIRNVSPATGSKFSLLPPDNATGNFTKVVQRVPVLIDFELPKDIYANLVAGMSVQVDIRTD